MENACFLAKSKHLLIGANFGYQGACNFKEVCLVRTARNSFSFKIIRNR